MAFVGSALAVLPAHTVAAALIARGVRLAVVAALAPLGTHYLARRAQER